MKDRMLTTEKKLIGKLSIVISNIGIFAWVLNYGYF
jgi:hypothetical protein